MQRNWLLLDLIHADRDANWLLHFDTFNAMLPCERAFDLFNYLRCGNALHNRYEDAARGFPNSIQRIY